MIGFDGLEFIALLAPEHRETLLSLSEDVQFKAEQQVLTRGRPSDSIYIVTEGVLEVRMSTDAPVVSRIGPGGIVGEMSWILERPPTAHVMATERTMALRLDHEHLRRSVADDPNFGLSLWAALAQTVADRLTSRSSVLGTLHSHVGEVEIPESLLAVGAVFEQIQSRCDKGEPVSDAEIDAVLGDLCSAIDEATALPSWDSGLRDLAQQALIPVVVQATNGRRIWEKPRGYAGDWETLKSSTASNHRGRGPSEPSWTEAFCDSQHLRRPEIEERCSRRRFSARPTAAVRG